MNQLPKLINSFYKLIIQILKYYYQKAFLINLLVARKHPFQTMHL